MQIYLLRHGIAEEIPAGGQDAARQLTAEGRSRLASVLKRAALAGVEPTLILTSPLARARQTAEIAAKALGCGLPPVETGTLVPSGDPELVWDELRLHQEEPQVLLAGHEPLFSRLAAFLLNAPGLEVDFKKGALMRVDCEALGPRPRGVLRWFLLPRLA